MITCPKLKNSLFCRHLRDLDTCAKVLSKAMLEMDAGKLILVSAHCRGLNICLHSSGVSPLGSAF